MLNNGKIDKSHSISNKFTNLSQSTKNKKKMQSQSSNQAI